MKNKFILILVASLLFILSCSKESNEDSCGKITVNDYYTQPTSIQIIFEKGNNANSTKIEYGVAGFTQGTGTTLTTSDSGITITNLNPSTTYDVYLTGICSTTEESKITKISSITTNPSTCTGIATASITQSTTTSVSLSFDYNDSNPAYYEVEYGPAGFALGSGTRVNSNGQFLTDNLTINSIQQSTTYDFYVRAVCYELAPNDTSSFRKYTYTTITSCPAPYNLNYFVVSGACNTGNGATYSTSWSYDYTASSYTVCIVPQGGQPSATSNAYIVSTNGATFSGMTCMWDAFYVRANCPNGTSSSWAGPYYF